MEKPRVIGRYALHERISSGGMATVYYGRLLGPVGFSRTVAIKQLHPQFSRDPDFVSMFVDEAHVAARIRHPNVVPVLDIVKEGRELYIVMEYVLGASLAEVIAASARAAEPIPHRVVSSMIGGCLRGLHAAHETTDDAGGPLGIVHRDVSPANVLVGRDGLARVLDFGIAKAASRVQVTRHGELKGKVGYMAPEQMRTGNVDRRADVYSVGVTLWEALTRRRAFAGDSDEVFNMRRREQARLPPPSRHDDLLAPFDDIVMKALAQKPEDRFDTAEAFADALEGLAAPAPIREVSRFVARLVGDKVDERAQRSTDLGRAASPSEVRAAIRDEVGVEIDDAPSISVSTWTDPSIDILALVEDDKPVSAVLEATTRDLPPRSSQPQPPTDPTPEPPPPEPPHPPQKLRPPQPPVARGGRPSTPAPAPAPVGVVSVGAAPPGVEASGVDEPPTAVVPVPELAASAPIDLRKEVATATPDWNNAAEPMSASPPVTTAAPSKGAVQLSTIVIAAAIVAVIVGGAVALSVLRDEPLTDPPTSSASPNPRTPTVTSAPEPAEPADPATPAPPTPTDSSGPTSRGGEPGAASATTSSPKTPTPRRRKPAADPFDALGGRH